MPRTEKEAERLHARHVLLDAAHGGAGHGGTRLYFPYDQCRDAADVLIRLSTLGFRSTERHLRFAVPVRASQTQHPGWHRGAIVRVGATQRGAGAQLDQIWHPCRLTFQGAILLCSFGISRVDPTSARRAHVLSSGCHAEIGPSFLGVGVYDSRYNMLGKS